MRMLRSIPLVLAVLAASGAAAAELGTLTKDGEKIPLTSSCAFVPRWDTQGWGKPEVIVLLSDKTVDCAAAAGWADPETAAFEQAVKTGRGALVSVSYKTGLKLGRVSVYGVGYTLGNDDCEGCVGTAAYAGKGLSGTIKTGAPLMLNSTPLELDARFDLPRPAAPAMGEKLPGGGGDPGKAYLAYLKAHAEGDYAALQKLMPEGKAEDEWGYYAEGEERKKAIQDEDVPRSAPILEGWRMGDSALLVVEVPHPWGGGRKAKSVVGLGLVGGSWRVREERVDAAGTMLGK
jgi:hypothetical protein